MAITKEQLATIIGGRAKALCSEDANKRMDKMKNKRNNGFDPDPSSFNDSDYYDNMYLSESISKSCDDYKYTKNDLEKSKLPKEIIESFATNVIDMSNSSNLSVLDEIGVKAQNKKIIREDNIKPNINNSNNIDYTIIKAIVNECLKEHLKTQQINESTSLKTIALHEGNISLVDNKGNIFRAKLEKIGNKNDKK